MKKVSWRGNVECSEKRTICLHCEAKPISHRPGLCDSCHAVRGIRRLYIRRKGWTPEWEQHLLELTDRAKKRLPLFEKGAGQ